MIVRCKKCRLFYDDEFRTTICPHSLFPANDGNNVFVFHHEAYLSECHPNPDHPTVSHPVTD
jgi:hypothetical protein